MINRNLITACTSIWHYFWKISVCGARYKTRPGLTYHYGHSHKEGASDENSRESNAPNPAPQAAAGGPPAVAPPIPMMGVPPAGAPPMQPVGVGVGGPNSLVGETPPTMPPSQGHVYQDSYVSFLNHPAGTALFFFTFQCCFCMHVYVGGTFFCSW